MTTLDGSGLSGYPVVLAGSGVTSATRLDGFTVRNPSGFGVGVGIRCTDGSCPVLANNNVRQNNAYGVYAGAGAGIATVSSSPTVWSNAIWDNRSYRLGGGVYCSGGVPVILNRSDYLQPLLHQQRWWLRERRRRGLPVQWHRGAHIEQ